MAGAFLLHQAPAFRKISCEIAYPLYGAHVFLKPE